MGSLSRGKRECTPEFGTLRLSRVWSWHHDYFLHATSCPIGGSFRSWSTWRRYRQIRRRGECVPLRATHASTDLPSSRPRNQCHEFTSHRTTATRLSSWAGMHRACAQPTRSPLLNVASFAAFRVGKLTCHPERARFLRERGDPRHLCFLPSNHSRVWFGCPTSGCLCQKWGVSYAETQPA
jgi:hypothetical protein